MSEVTGDLGNQPVPGVYRYVTSSCSTMMSCIDDWLWAADWINWFWVTTSMAAAGPRNVIRGSDSNRAVETTGAGG